MNPSPTLTRRHLLQGAAVGAGAAAGIGLERALAADDRPPAAPLDWNGRSTIAFSGPHQPGIEIAPQAHQTLTALELGPDATRDSIARMLRLLSDDAARMMRGQYALADSEPEFASVPANLTITFGVGPRLVRLAAGDDAVPAWLAPLPHFPIDRLEDRWSGGDLLLQVASDDPITVSHSVRMLLKDCRSFAAVAWQQPGFRRAYGSEAPGTTMRNLLGQLDGTKNLAPGTAAFDAAVWLGDAAGWLAGGTSLVIRRTKLHLDKWDRLDRTGREAAVGRRLGNGAPLTGTDEHDEPDFAATTPIGFPVIAEFAHIARARPSQPGEVIFRRGYNYDHGATSTELTDAGLIFTSFQADITTQFLPIQTRLAEFDLLNEWTTPIGSAVFAIPPGATEGGFVGETIL